MANRIPVAAPSLHGNEKKYVLDCLESGWISSAGPYIEKFESAFAEFCGTKHAIACCNGTAALHLALLAVGVEPSDEVIVPTLTYVSTANAVTYCNARPVFVDSEPDTWNINAELIEPLINERTKAIIPVHLFGHPVDMNPIMELAKKYQLAVIEDAAEAHGATYYGQIVGSIGDAATFSFYGNKLMTTGEGGMVVTNDDKVASSARQLRGQGLDPNRRYWFPVVGYNYRMTNICAAIGLAQLENIEWQLSRRREVAIEYQNYLKDLPLSVQPEKSWARNVYWMNCIVLDDSVQSKRDDLTTKLDRLGIETRPFFHPMHTLPVYEKWHGEHTFPVAERSAARGLCLPSFADLSAEQVAEVCSTLHRILTNG